MSIPQTPDSIRKSQQEKAPPQTPEDARRDQLSSEDEGDRAEERQGGHRPG